jgi:hypothetical protein
MPSDMFTAHQGASGSKVSNSTFPKPRRENRSSRSRSQPTDQKINLTPFLSDRVSISGQAGLWSSYAPGSAASRVAMACEF